MAEEKVAVVTGSSSGIGLLTAVELALNGYRVVATMRNLDNRGRLEEAAQKAGVRDRLDLRRLDITEFDSLPGAVDAIVRDHGRIDVLVNNAGFSSGRFRRRHAHCTRLRHQLETNFFGNVAMTKAVLPVMRKQKSGHIIQVTFGRRTRWASPCSSAYSASKFALEGWSESLRIEVHSLGIRVVLVEPGSYDTDIWDAQRGDCGRRARSRIAQQGAQPALRRVREEQRKTSARCPRGGEVDRPHRAAILIPSCDT